MQAAVGISETVIPYGFAEGDYDLSDDDGIMNGAPQAPVRAKWDCATIVSTYTNTENHPTLVDDDDDLPSRRKRQQRPAVIQLSSKSGACLDCCTCYSLAEPGFVWCCVWSGSLEDNQSLVW